MVDDEIEIELVDENTPQERAEAKVTTAIHDPVQSHVPLAEFLGVADIYHSENIKQLEAVSKFLENKASIGDKFKALRAIEQKLTKPSLGESRLNRVYRFVRAQEAVEEARSIRDAFLGDED